MNSASIRNSKTLFIAIILISIFAIGSSAALIHLILAKYDETIQQSELWAMRIYSLERIEALASAANAPGNNVFETKNPRKERLEMRKIANEFYDFLEKNGEDLQLHANGDTKPLLHVKHFREKFDDMARQAERIFLLADKDQWSLAAREMARMDQTYSQLRESLEEADEGMRRSQLNLLQRQKLEIQKIESIQIFFAALALLLAAILSYHGYLILKLLREAMENKAMLEEQTAALNATAIVAITHLDGKIKYVNDKFVEITGYSREELIGKDHRIINSGFHPKEFFRDLWNSIQQGKIWRGEVKNRRKDGTDYWVDSTIIPMRNSKGKIWQYVGIRSEITARKKMEEEIWLANETQRAILESTNHSIISTDIFGTIRTFNAGAEKMLGFKSAEVIGKKNLADFHDPEELIVRARQFSHELQTAVQPGLDTLLAKVRDGGTSHESEWTYVRNNGTKVPVSLTVSSLLGRNGKTLGFLGISQDISDRKNNEHALRESKLAAENATQVKSRFLANMSHEIRTPMNGIIGMANLLGENVTDPSCLEKIKIIQSCGNSLLELLNDVLDFSTIEAEKMELNNASFPIHSTIEEVVALMQARGQEKDLRLYYRPGVNVPNWVEADQNRMRQVLTNLVSNAVKFTEFGQIDVYSNAEVTASGQWKILISVRDTGVGIPEELKGRLFQSFSQLDASSTRKFGGTGLGLAICKGIVEKMGGRIWHEENPPKGTIFSFNFLATEGKPKLQPPVANSFLENAAKLGPLKPLRILVAEDNPTNQAVVTKILKRLGYQADVAANGQQALEMTQANIYDLVLMDCHMPIMDGFEATRKIREKFSTGNCPRIIALTASSTHEDVRNCLAAGMNGHLAKPISIPLLTNLLRSFANDSDQEIA